MTSIEKHSYVVFLTATLSHVPFFLNLQSLRFLGMPDDMKARIQALVDQKVAEEKAARKEAAEDL